MATTSLYARDLPVGTASEACCLDFYVKMQYKVSVPSLETVRKVELDADSCKRVIKRSLHRPRRLRPAGLRRAEAPLSGLRQPLLQGQAVRSDRTLQGRVERRPRGFLRVRPHRL